MTVHSDPSQPNHPGAVLELPTATVDLVDVRVEYRLVPGTRPGTVVMFHGGHMRAGLPLSEAALVAAGYTVLVPSRPGYGRTSLAAGPDPARFARTIAALCHRLQLRQVLAVVGVSAGGPTAVAMAALFPDQVRSLVLHSARSSLPFPDGASRLAAPIAFNPRLEAASWAGVRQLMRRRPSAGLRFMMASLSTLPARHVVEDLTPTEQQLLAGTFAHMRSSTGFLNDIHQRSDPALEKQITQPTLIVASPHDGQVHSKHAEHLAHAIPHATTWASPSLSHLIWHGSGGPATQERTNVFLRSVATDNRC